MDIAALRTQPHLSASGISDYRECGLRYKFRRIDHIEPEFTSDSLVFGGVIHKALELFHLCRIDGIEFPLDELLEYFEELWKESVEGNSRIRYKKGKDFGILMADGKALLTAYHEQLPKDNFRVIAVEKPFSFTIPEVFVPIIGVIDLLEEDTSGTVIVVDFKTASKAYAMDEADKSLQLTLYSMALKANGYQDRDILLRFDCLLKTKIPRFEQQYSIRSESDERRTARLIQTVWEGISSGHFVPGNTSWKCNYCEFRSACRDFFNT